MSLKLYKPYRDMKSYSVSSARDPTDLKQFPQSYIETIEGRKIRWFHVSDKSPGSYLCAAPLLKAVGVEAASLLWFLSWTHHTPVCPSQSSAGWVSVRFGLLQERKDSFTAPLSANSRWSLLIVLQRTRSLPEEHCVGVLLKQVIAQSSRLQG